MPPIFLLDTSPLVTLCVFRLNGLPLLAHFLRAANIQITDGVAEEITIQHTKSDAQIARSYIRAGTIAVFPAPAHPQISDFYKLHETDCGVIRVGLENRGSVNTVIDDKEAYIVATRYGLRPFFLLDALLTLVKQHNFSSQLATSMVHSMQSRYSSSYVAHTLSVLAEQGT